MELQLLTIKQVSEILAVKESTIRTWINRKIFPNDVTVNTIAVFNTKVIDEIYYAWVVIMNQMQKYLWQTHSPTLYR